MVAPSVREPVSAEVSESHPSAPAWRNVLLRVAVATGAGVLVYLSGPPRTLWWLAPIGLALLGAVLYGRRPRAGFGYATCFGLGYLIPLLAWTGEFVGVVAWLPLSLAEALLMGLAGAAIATVSVLPAWPVWAALLWAAGEALRAVFPFGGFPWAKIAFTQPDGIYLPLAAIAGTPLIGFAVALTGFGAAVLVRGLILDRQPRRLLAPALATLLPVGAAFATIPLVGTDANAGEATIAVVQGNVPRLGLDFNAQRRAVLDNHVRRTEELADDIRQGRKAQPDLVIWPENASDIDPFRNPDARAAIDRAARAIDAPIALGSLLIGDDGLPRNTVLLWDPERGPVDQYTKRQLQPFGETMPMRDFFRLFTSQVDRANNFVAGTEATVFRMANAKVALATCYEVAFDGVVRESVAGGSNLLAVPTNNATFGLTEMTYQQLAMDRVRAVEHGRTVAVAATSGVSAIVRPDGTVNQETGLFTDAALVERVPLRSTTTLSDQLGPAPEWVLVLAGVGALGIAIVIRRRSRNRGTVPANNEAGA